MNIHSFLQQHRHQHIAVGLSGGVDSMVLLHLLKQARDRGELTLSAIHVHHGLHANADDWANFCAHICANWHIPLTIKRVQVQPQHLGIEAAARVARYQAYRSVQMDCLALAHHQDDQVETFFLAALRGSGVRGLAAMAMEYHSGSLNIARPLLPHTRADIEHYATQHHLPHIHDDSNQETDLLRNWLRQCWLPQLHQRVPHASRHILAAIANVQDELALINEIQQCDAEYIDDHHLFNINKWRTLSPARRRQQLLTFAKRHQLGTPRRVSVLDFERILLENASGAQWHLPLGNAVAHRGRLFALSKGWQNQLVWREAISGCLHDLIATNGMSWQASKIGLPDPILQQIATLRTVQADDGLMTPSGYQRVSKILKKHHVPLFLRPYYPVIVDARGECLAVIGLAVNARVAVKNGWLPECGALSAFLVQSESSATLPESAPSSFRQPTS